MKKIYILSALLTLLSTHFVAAQNIFWGLGYGVVSLTTPHAISRSFGGGSSFQPSQQGYGLSYNLGVDAPLFSINEDMSIGLHASPGIGLYAVPSSEILDGFGYFVNSPLMAQFNWGNFSTADASQDIGFGFGFGLNALYMLDVATILDEPMESGSTLLLQPAARASFRWWSKSSKLYTLNFTYSFGSDQTPNNGPQNRNTAMLSLIRYMNY